MLFVLGRAYASVSWIRSWRDWYILERAQCGGGEELHLLLSGVDQKLQPDSCDGGFGALCCTLANDAVALLHGLLAYVAAARKRTWRDGSVVGFVGAVLLQHIWVGRGPAWQNRLETLQNSR